MGMLDQLPRRERLIKWLVDRQQIGFQGRVNKPDDTCYSFWIGATLVMLGAYHLIDTKLLCAYTIGCQKKQGGFAKWTDQYQDVLHTYFGLAGLSLAGHPGLAPIDCALGMTQRASGVHYIKPE
jgi:geranylgeranyl transferase type-1 subunit beta